MTRVSWRLVDVLSRLLEPIERDAVLGDLVQSGETGAQALCDLLGLVVRRQAALWWNDGQWATLLGMIVPLGMLLSIKSRHIADTGAISIWVYANNWDWALLKIGGFWYAFVDSAKVVFIRYLVLFCCSWSSGFLLGLMSRRRIWLNAVLFCLMLLFGELVGAPRYLAFSYPLWAAQHADPNDSVFALRLYGVVFPLIVQALLGAIPSMWGFCHGTCVERLRPSLRRVLWAVAITTLIAMSVQEPAVFVFVLRAYRHPEIWQIVQFVVFWPIAYFVASAGWRMWHQHGTVSASGESLPQV